MLLASRRRFFPYILSRFPMSQTIFRSKKHRFSIFWWIRCLFLVNQDFLFFFKSLQGLLLIPTHCSNKRKKNLLISNKRYLIFYKALCSQFINLPKTPIGSVCQSSSSELPHEQYHLTYIHQLKMEIPDYAFSYFLWPKPDLHSHNSIYTNVRKYHRHL